MSPLVHNELVLDTLVFLLCSLGLKSFLGLFCLLGVHLRIILGGGRTGIRQGDIFNIGRIREKRGMGHEAALRDPRPIFELVLLLVPTKPGNEMPTKAESGCTDWKVFGLVLLQRFHESVYSGAGNCWTAEEHERQEMTCEIECVTNFRELVPEASGGEGIDRVQ